MTTTTLSPTDLTSALMSKLKADVGILAVVPTEDIAEANFMEDEFDYPALRVYVDSFNPLRLTGNCYGQFFEFSASVYAFAEGASSKSCQDLMGLVGRLFMKGTISNAALKSETLNADYIPPIPNGVNLWRGEVVVTGRVYEL